MGLNISELTLTTLNSIELNLTEFTAVNNLVAMVTMVLVKGSQFVLSTRLYCALK
jgi:hypothetical protein